MKNAEVCEQTLSRISVNEPGRIVYINGEKEISFREPNQNACWTVFRQLASQPNEIISLHEIQNLLNVSERSSALKVVNLLASRLMTEHSICSPLQGIVIENVPFLQLNADVFVVKSKKP